MKKIKIRKRKWKSELRDDEEDMIKAEGELRMVNIQENENDEKMKVGSEIHRVIAPIVAQNRNLK